MLRRFSFAVLPCAIVAVALLTSSTARSQTTDWTGAATNWNNPSSWNNGLPGATNSPEFNGATTNLATVNDISALVVPSVLVTSAQTSPVSISGTAFSVSSTGNTATTAALSVQGGGLSILTGAANTTGLTLAVTGETFNVATGQTLTFGSSTVTNNIAATTATSTLALTGGGTVATFGNLQLNGGLTLNGITLQVTNTAAGSGGVTYTNLTAQLANGLGYSTTAAPVTVQGTSTLQIRANGAANTTADNLTYGNSITLAAAASLTLNLDRFSGTGTTKAVSFGFLNLGNGSTFTQVVANSYQSRFVASGTTTTTTHVVTGTTTLNIAGVMTIDGQIIGSTVPTINKNTGTGDLLLNNTTASNSNSNTFGTLNVNAGRVIFGSAVTLGSANTVNVASGAAVAFGYQLNAAQLAITNNGAMNFLSGSTVSSRAIGSVFGAATTFPTTGSLIVGNDASQNYTLTIPGNYPTLTGDLTYTFGGNLTATGITVGGLTVGGNLTLGAANRTVTVAYGAAAASNINPAISNFLTINGTTVLGTSNLTMAVTAGATLAGPITGSGTLTKTGTGYLSITNPNNSGFSGAVTLSAGQIVVGGTGSLGTNVTPVTIPTGTAINAGENFALTQAFVNTLNPTSAGLLGFGSTSPAAGLNLSAFPTLRIGASSAPATGSSLPLPGYLANDLTPNASTYRFGTLGANAHTVVTAALTSGTTLDVNGGNLSLLNAGNTFTTLSASGTANVTGTSNTSFGAVGGAITLAGTSGLTFANSFDLDAGRTLSLTGTGGLTILRGAATNLPGNILAGSGTLGKQGAGTLTLSAPLASTDTRNVTTNAGLFVVPQASGQPLGAGVVTFNGDFTYAPTGGTAGNSASIDQSTAAATISPVYTSGTLRINRGGYDTATISLGGTTGALSRGANGVLVLAPATGVSSLGVTERFIVPGQTPYTNGVATTIFGRDIDANGTGYFVNQPNVTNGFVPVIPSNTTLGSNVSTDVVDSGNATLTGANTVYALRATGAINLATFTQTVGGGVVILNSATVSNGTLAMGAEGTIYTSGTSTISAGISGTAINLTGPGTTTFTGANSFTGGLVINGGTLEIAGPGQTDSTILGSIGARTITLRGGTFSVTGATYDPANGTKTFVIDPAGGTFRVASGTTFTLNDSAQFSGTGPLTKQGVGTLVLGSLGVTYTFSGATYVDAGTLRAVGASSLGSGTGFDTAVTVANGATLDINSNFGKVLYLAGTGVGGIGALTASNSTYTYVQSGTVNLTADTAIGSSNTAGLTIASPVLGSFALTKVGTGILTLTNAGNQQTSNTATAGLLAASSDAALGPVPASPTANIILNGGGFGFTSTFATAANRTVTIGTAGGTIAVSAGNTGTITSAIPTTTGVFTKDGPGTLNLNGNSLTVGGLSIIGGNNTTNSAVTGLGASTLTGFSTLTVNGNVSLGTSTTAGTATTLGQILIPNGSTFTVNGGTTGTVYVGNALSGSGILSQAGSVGIITTPTPATDSVTVNITTGSLGVGSNGITAPQSQGGLFILPAGSGTVANLTATTSIRVGGDLNNNTIPGFITATLTLGGGTNTLTTPILQVGGAKSTALLNVRPGGIVTINNGLGATALTLGNFQVGSGYGPTSTLDFTGAGTVNAAFSTIVLTNINNSTAGGSETSVLTLAGAANSTYSTTGTTTLAQVGNAAPGSATLNVNNGTVSLGGDIVAGAGAGAGTKTANLNVTGGTLNFNNNNIIQSGSGGATTFNVTFSGGTIRDLGTVTKNITQTGGTLDRASTAGTATTAITGSYTATNGTIQTATGTTFSTTAGLTVGGGAAGTTPRLAGTGTVAGAVTITNRGTISPGFSIGEMTVTGAQTWLTGGTYAWEFGTDTGPGTPGVTHDHINGSATGTLALGSLTSAARFNVTVNPYNFTPNNVTFAPQTYTIATFSSISGFTGSNQFNVTGSGFYGTPTVFVDPGFPTLLQITFVPTPEPTTVFGIAAAGFGAASWLRRRFKK